MVVQTGRIPETVGHILCHSRCLPDVRLSVPSPLRHTAHGRGIYVLQPGAVGAMPIASGNVPWYQRRSGFSYACTRLVQNLISLNLRVCSVSAISVGRRSMLLAP